MSFFRPEARRLIARWSESAVYAAATLGGGYWLALRGPAAPLWRWGLIAALIAVGALLLRSAVLSALARGDGQAPGVVRIDERRIAYLGPHKGGLVSINDIQTIEVRTADAARRRAAPEWVLRGTEAEEALVIPVSAEGAEGLADAFSALPGFPAEKALAALRGPAGATVAIWRRRGAVEAAALAPPPTRA